jgi:CubicO group peptidase (beta-lactamase class C family)
MSIFLGSLALAAVLTTSSGVSPALESCIATEARKLEFSGVFSVVRPEGTITRASGVVAGPGSSGITGETRFNIASAGKMFTAVAVAQLVDSKKVRLEDPVGRHVPGLTPEASQVTVRQLLDDGSGLGNFFTPGNLEVIQRARSLADLFPLVASASPSFTPGSRYEYSNTGFLLLGLLVERVAGVSYGRYLDEHVFGPAGMVATGLEPGSGPKQAIGMTTFRGPLRPSPEAALRATPAGGAFSTAGDLESFFAALLAGRLTSPAMLRELSSPQRVIVPAKGDAPQISQGLGFGLGTFQGHRWLGHNGGAPGVNVEAMAFLDDRTAVVILSNRDPPAATAFLRQVREALFDPDRAKQCAALH